MAAPPANPVAARRIAPKHSRSPPPPPPHGTASQDTPGSGGGLAFHRGFGTPGPVTRAICAHRGALTPRRPCQRDRARPQPGRRLRADCLLCGRASPRSVVARPTAPCRCPMGRNSPPIEGPGCDAVRRAGRAGRMGCPSVAERGRDATPEAAGFPAAANVVPPAMRRGPPTGRDDLAGRD